jgi:hypothetical protein
MPCNVADQFCTHPANLEGVRDPKTKCYVCGYAVCENCSVRRQYGPGVPRVCHDCCTEIDGNDDRAMRHLEKQAGY